MCFLRFVFCGPKSTLGKQHSSQALEYSDQCGSAASRRSAAANTGNLLFLAGDFQSAYEYFQKALSIFPSSGSRQHAILDSLAQVRLAQSRFDECEEFLGQIDSQILRESDRGFYAHRHAEVTRAKLQISQNRLNPALRSISNAIDLARTAQDHTLLRVAFLIRAEIFQRLGRSEECIKSLQIAMEGLLGQSPQSFSRCEQIVLRELQNQKRSDEAVPYLARARRIDEVATNIPALPQIDHGAEAVAVPPISEVYDVRDIDKRHQNILHSLALITLHSSRPDLVARELAEILVGSGCVLAATVETGQPEGPVEVIARIHSIEPSLSLPMRRFRIGSERRGVSGSLTASGAIDREPSHSEPDWSSN